MKLRITSWVYVAAAVICFAACVTVFVEIVNNIGVGYSPKDSWIADALQYKHELCQRTTSPKIVVIGGSEALFSVDSKFLSELTGRPVVNCATHAGIPLRFYPEILEGKVNPGDYVICSLAFTSHHNETERKLFSDLIIPMYWNQRFPDFKSALTWSEMKELYACYGVQWINDSLFRDRSRDVGKLEDAYAAWSSKTDVERKHYGYYYYTMNEHGDRLSQGCKYPVWTTKSGLKRTNSDISTGCTVEFQRSVDRLRDFAVRKRALLIFVCGNLYHYSEFKSLGVFDKRLKEEAGVDFNCNYATLSFPFRYYYDTQLHMNSCGARLYTYEMAKTVNRRLLKPHPSLSNWPVTVFRERPEAIESAPISLYPHGVLVQDQKFKVHLRVPENLRGKNCVAYFLIDRNGGEGKVVRSVDDNGKPCYVEECAWAQKNELEVHFQADDRDSVRLDFNVARSVGMERVIIDEDDCGHWDFRTGGPYMEGLKGFSVCSYPHGCWSVGTNSLLRLKVARMKEDAELEFCVSSCQIPNYVEVWAQKRKVAHWLFAEKGRAMQEVRIPSELIPANGIVDLEFRVAKTYCPKEAGTSIDPRRLGLLFFEASQLNFKRPSESQYVITLDMNGGVSRSSAHLLLEGGRWQNISAPMRAGYDFAGWKVAEGKILSSALYSMKSGEALKLPTDGSPFGGGKGFCSMKGLTEAGKTVALKAMWVKAAR